MAKNIHDLNRSVTKIQEGLDRRSEERGKQAADRLLTSTRRGGGFWLIFIYPIAFVLSQLAAGVVSTKMGLCLPTWAYLLVGFVGATWAGGAWTGK